MRDEVEAYIEYLKSCGNTIKPTMPNFDLSAYNDNEYIFAIDELMLDFDKVDDLNLTLYHLKGE